MIILKSTHNPVKRIGIIGEPGTGKTTLCTQLPNPLFLDLDGKLPPNQDYVPIGHPDILTELGFDKSPKNTADALLVWLQRNLPKLPPERSIILDSFSSLEESFHTNARLDPERYMSKGDPRKGVLPSFDGFKFYREWKSYVSTLFSFFSAAPQTTVVIFHEQPEYSSTGTPTGRVRPVCDGSFRDRVAGKFSLFVRTLIHSSKYMIQVRPSRMFGSILLPPGTNIPDSDLIPNEPGKGLETLFNLVYPSNSTKQ